MPGRQSSEAAEFPKRAAAGQTLMNLWIHSMIISEGEKSKGTPVWISPAAEIKQHLSHPRGWLNCFSLLSCHWIKNQSNNHLWDYEGSSWDNDDFKISISGILLVLLKTFLGLVDFWTLNEKPKHICDKECVVDIQLSFITTCQPLDGSHVRSHSTRWNRVL